MKRKTWSCHDCGVKEGELHQEGCDMETCVDCGGQLISCDCEVKKFGEIPYLLIPNLCRLCGKQWPDMFGIPDGEWDNFVLPELKLEVLCRECYKEVKAIFPKGWRSKKKSRQSN